MFNNKLETIATTPNYTLVVGPSNLNGKVRRYQVINSIYNVVEHETHCLVYAFEMLKKCQKDLDEYFETYQRKDESS